MASPLSWHLAEDFYPFYYALKQDLLQAKKAIIIRTPELSWTALSYWLTDASRHVPVSVETSNVTTPEIARLMLYRSITIREVPLLSRTVIEIDSKKHYLIDGPLVESLLKNAQQTHTVKKVLQAH